MHKIPVGVAICLVLAWYSQAEENLFWKQWGDGQAEVAAYDLVIPRDNELRRGVAVSIFMTENFLNTRRVKADASKNSAIELGPVMKLNLMKDFQTGIYDYHDMLSAFGALAPANGRPAGVLTKVVYSRQEWRGNTSQHSCAKYAAAFFKRSRSSFTEANYRFSRSNSASRARPGSVS